MRREKAVAVFERKDRRTIFGELFWRIAHDIKDIICNYIKSIIMSILLNTNNELHWESLTQLPAKDHEADIKGNEKIVWMKI